MSTLVFVFVLLVPLYDSAESFPPSPPKVGFLARKRPNFDKNWPLKSFWAKYWPFRPSWCHARPKNIANELPRWLSDTWLPKALLPLKRTKVFGPKQQFLPQNIHFGANIGLAPSWLVVGCGALAALTTERLPTLELS